MKLKDVITGIILLVLLWIVNVFIAFVPFNKDSPTEYIILTWIIVDALIIRYGFKIKRVTRNSMKVVGLALISLVILYLVPINTNIPADAQELNTELSEDNEERMQYASDLFHTMEAKWTSPTRQYLLEPQKNFFIKDFEAFWKVEGYVPSNIQAELYLKMLLDSERFSEDEVKVIHGWCVNSPHGVVKFHNNFYADFWAQDHFDHYKFGQKTEMPCDELFFVPYE